MMSSIANKWWFAVLTLVLYSLGDLATSVANFASNLPDNATVGTITFKDWLLFFGSTTASLVLTIRGLMSNAWQNAHKSPPVESTAIPSQQEGAVETQTKK